MKYLLAACLLFAQVSLAVACAPAYARGMKVRVASESALIVWDAKEKKEHFIRRANFDTQAAYFGFLVPTPSRPHLGEVPNRVFDQLEAMTAPKIKVEQKVRYTSLFGGFADTSFSVGNATPRAAAGGVEVVDRQQVAGGEAVVLKADDAGKLRKWLEDNGFEARPQLTDWLDAYVKQGWYITAFQFKKQNDRARGLATKAVRLTFDTDRPFYPYREPADSRENVTGSRFLRVFFVAEGRYQGTLGESGAWPGRAAWSNPLEAGQSAGLQAVLHDEPADARLSSPPADLPAGAWLTVFDDASSPRPGTDEVYFSRSADQTTLERPPIIRYEYVSRVNPAEVVALSGVCLLLVAGGAFLIWRFSRQPA